MTTHSPLMTNTIAPLASPSRSWVINSTPSYTVPTLPSSLTLPSSALPALFADLTSALGPHTPLQQTAILLDKASTRSTSTVCTQLIYSLESHFLKHQPSASPGPVPSLPSSLASPRSKNAQCQVCQNPFKEERMLLCDI